MIGLLALVGLFRIHLQRRTAALGQEWEQRHGKLTIATQERQNLLMQREHLTDGDYILSRAGELGLGPPVPGQVRRMEPQEVATRSPEPDPDMVASGP